MMVGCRVFEQFVWLEVGSVKAALSRPAYQRVTHTVGQPVERKKRLLARISPLVFGIQF